MSAPAHFGGHGTALEPRDDAEQQSLEQEEQESMAQQIRMATMTGTISQLGRLSSHATQVFQDLVGQATHLSDRVGALAETIQHLEEQLDKSADRILDPPAAEAERVRLNGSEEERDDKIDNGVVLKAYNLPMGRTKKSRRNSKRSRRRRSVAKSNNLTAATRDQVAKESKTASSLSSILLGSGATKPAHTAEAAIPTSQGLPTNSYRDQIDQASEAGRDTGTAFASSQTSRKGRRPPPPPPPRKNNERQKDVGKSSLGSNVLSQIRSRCYKLRKIGPPIIKKFIFPPTLSIKQWTSSVERTAETAQQSSFIDSPARSGPLQEEHAVPLDSQQRRYEAPHDDRPGQYKANASPVLHSWKPQGPEAEERQRHHVNESTRTSADLIRGTLGAQDRRPWPPQTAERQETRHEKAADKTMTRNTVGQRGTHQSWPPHATRPDTSARTDADQPRALRSWSPQGKRPQGRRQDQGSTRPRLDDAHSHDIQSEIGIQPPCSPPAAPVPRSPKQPWRNRSELKKAYKVEWNSPSQGCRSPSRAGEERIKAIHPTPPSLKRNAVDHPPPSLSSAPRPWQKAGFSQGQNTKLPKSALTPSVLSSISAGDAKLKKPTPKLAAPVKNTNDPSSFLEEIRRGKQLNQTRPPKPAPRDPSAATGESKISNILARRQFVQRGREESRWEARGEDWD